MTKIMKQKQHMVTFEDTIQNGLRQKNFKNVKILYSETSEKS